MTIRKTKENWLALIGVVGGWGPVSQPLVDISVDCDSSYYRWYRESCPGPCPVLEVFRVTPTTVDPVPSHTPLKTTTLFEKRTSLRKRESLPLVCLSVIQTFVSGAFRTGRPEEGSLCTKWIRLQLSPCRLEVDRKG